MFQLLIWLNAAIILGSCDTSVNTVNKSPDVQFQNFSLNKAPSTITCPDGGTQSDIEDIIDDDEFDEIADGKWTCNYHDCDDFADEFNKECKKRIATGVTCKFSIIHSNDDGHAINTICKGGMCCAVEPQSGEVINGSCKCGTAFDSGAVCEAYDWCEKEKMGEQSTDHAPPEEELDRPVDACAAKGASNSECKECCKEECPGGQGNWDEDCRSKCDEEHAPDPTPAPKPAPDEFTPCREPLEECLSKYKNRSCSWCCQYGIPDQKKCRFDPPISSRPNEYMCNKLCPSYPEGEECKPIPVGMICDIAADPASPCGCAQGLECTAAATGDICLPPPTNPPQNPSPECSEFGDVCDSKADCCNSALECSCAGGGTCSQKSCRIPQCAASGQKCGSIPIWESDPGNTANVSCCNATQQCQGPTGNQVCVDPSTNPQPTNPPSSSCVAVNQDCFGNKPCCDPANNACTMVVKSSTPVAYEYLCKAKPNAPACKSPSASCASGSECCSGTCTNGQCANSAPACIDESQTCTLSSECCGGTCQFSASFGTKVCSDNHSPQCRGNGATCTATSECCSGSNCTDFLMDGNKTCRSQSLPPICRQENLSCTNSAECCRGSCLSGVCKSACKTAGQSCGSAAKGSCCTDLLCSGGTCIDTQPGCPTEMRNGKVCSYWQNCCSSYCNSFGKCADPP